MSKRIGILVAVLLTLCGTASAQIVNGLDTLYGNEWIEADQQYLRLEVTTDGFYRINSSDLLAQGWPVSSINSADYQIFHNGEQLPLHSTAASDTPLGTGDGLIFYGEQNRGELDQHLYREPEAQQLNPRYSLYNNQGVYYLTWKEGAGQNFTTVNNDLSSLPAAESYVWRQTEEVFTEKFVKEYYRFSGATLYYSHYSIGEGYGSRAINELLADGSTTQEINLALPQSYSSGPAAVVRTRYVAALFDHLQQLSANDVLLRTDTFTNWAMQNVEMALPTTVLVDQELRLRWDGLAGEKDEVSVGFVQVDYPAQADAAGANSFNCRVDNSGNRQYLELANLSANSAVVYDLNNQIRIPVANPDGTLRVGLPVVSIDRDLRIIADEASLPVPAISSVDLALPDLGDANYIILTHSLLRSGSEDAVQAYADYRASANGGSYRPAIVNVDGLYDQFAYGVQQHPLAIRNFVAWQEEINPAFEFLFIVGKGREYIDLRDPADLSEALGTTLFIPPFGFPGSDNLLASTPDKPTPRVNIGRLSAINSAEVMLYLNKIRGTESLVASIPQTIADRSWTKNILHLGGGGNASEQQSIRNNLEAMANTAESGQFGADVTGIYKASTDPIETSQSDFIFSRINAGVSMITFFGHSSAGTFDFSIDNPENYENNNKYPLMLSLGCYSGNMFAEFRSIGERFLLLENGGAGVYGASRGLGFIHALNSFGRYFYNIMSNDLYGATVGEGLRVSIENFEGLTDQAFGSLMEQFSLQGDPAFRLNPAPGVDLAIDPATVSFTPTVVNVQRDSFDFSFDLYNLGKVEDGEVEYRIEQELPDGERRLLYTERTNIPHYQERITV
ncbi:MAG: C25 family cysteine peptidase, partial [Bacteroidota bacterium]